MKKNLLTILAIVIANIAFSQTPTVDTKKPTMSKEEKIAMKAKQETEMNDALKGAGLDEKQIASAKEIVADATKKSNELKTNNALSDAEKETAKKLISDDKNSKLKALMGDKYKAYNEIRKSQKAAAAPAPKAE